MKYIATLAAVLTCLLFLFYIKQDQKEVEDLGHVAVQENADNDTFVEKAVSPHDYRSPAGASPSNNALDQTSTFTYETPEEFYHQLDKASRKWLESRGYHLSEDFANYSGPENYQGPHPYGYLSELELKALSDQGDQDARILYAYYYLSKSDKKSAIDLYELVAVETEQTLPLGALGAYLMVDAQNLSRTDNTIDLASARVLENKASAYFRLMDIRNDPEGAEYLETTGYYDYDEERKSEIETLALEIASQFKNKRADLGLPPHKSEPFDPFNTMGISQEEFDFLLELYSSHTN